MRPPALFDIRPNGWYPRWYRAARLAPDTNGAPAMALSYAKIRSVKPGAKIQKLSDGGGLGLQLCVMPTGSKLWRVAYSLHNKPKTLSLGAYPAVGIAAARRATEAARAVLASGMDPNLQKRSQRLAKATSAGNTFKTIAQELIAKKKREGRSERTLKKLRWLFDLVQPSIGLRPVADIEAPEVLAALRIVEAKGQFETAGRLRAVIGEVFRFAIATGRTSNDPTFALCGALTAPKVTHRAATDAKGLGALLRAIDGFEGQATTKACLQLMALLFPRPGELRLARWTEFDFVGAVWTIPAARTKMRREFQIPLSRQAIDILQGLLPLTGRYDLVFSDLRTATRPISENTMNAALRRLGFAQDEMTSHGFRAAASTLLNESGEWSPDAIERALAHQDADAVRRAYARGAHWKERVKMMQSWADQLDAMRLAA
jgi:integrase